jgi:hypothetical protein
MEDTPDKPTGRIIGPQSKASAEIVRKIRSAYIVGTDVVFDAKAAGDIADHIEELASMVDYCAAESSRLRMQYEGLHREADDLFETCEFLKALVIQSQKPK